MFDSVLLDVIVGLAFVYLLLSLICSAIQEIIASILGWRAKTLKSGIANLLADPNIAGLKDKVYAHPLVEQLSRTGGSPSYIPARNFAIALLDELKKSSNPGATQGALAEAQTTVTNLPDGPIKTSLQGMIEEAQGDLVQIRKNVEAWFDNSMDRVAGWYKRNTQRWMFGIALVLAVSLNIDSIDTAKRLWQDPTLRSQFVAAAESYSADPSAARSQTVAELKAELEALPLGWDAELRDAFPKMDGALFLKLIGWLITAIAVSLGAPFWFDGLGKILNIRATGGRPAPQAAASS